MTALSDELRRAVDWAKEAIQIERMKDGWDLATSAGWEARLNQRAGELIKYSDWWGFINGPFSKDPGEFNLDRAKSTWDDRVSDFLARAQTDRRYFDAVILGLASAIEDSEEIHPKLRPFLAGYLRGRIKPPKPKRGRGESEGLHIIIVRTVEAMAAADWQTFRNEASPKRSACDVVALALAELGLSPITYSGVAKIFNNRDKELADFRRTMREAEAWSNKASD